MNSFLIHGHFSYSCQFKHYEYICVHCNVIYKWNWKIHAILCRLGREISKTIKSVGNNRKHQINCFDIGLNYRENPEKQDWVSWEKYKLVDLDRITWKKEGRAQERLDKQNSVGVGLGFWTHCDSTLEGAESGKEGITWLNKQRKISERPSLPAEPNQAGFYE